MPLNVRKFGASWFLVLIFVCAGLAQSPTSADLWRERITKVKAMVVLKQYTAAIYELEGIRRETNEPTVNNAAQVMLMNCYLEQADYKRAQTLLTELFNAQKGNKPNANYFAVAAQVVKGARTQLERYKSLGLTINDRNLPVNAVADIDKMRETVELVVTQSKGLGENKKDTPTAMALIEEATTARSGLARDDYDAKRWKDVVADAREDLMKSRSVVNAVDDSAFPQNTSANTVAQNTTPAASKQNETSAPVIPVSNPITTPTAAPAVNGSSNQVKTEDAKLNETVAKTDKTEILKTSEKSQEAGTAEVANRQVAQVPQNTNAGNTEPTSQPSKRSRVVQSPNPPVIEAANAQNAEAAPSPDIPKTASPITVGSLLEYATEKVNPAYPPAAKTMRMTGTVRVDVLVNEDGQISVENTTGPSMLQRAALDAVKKWKFKPFVRDGQPVKAKGYLNFSFNL